ncbi:unnamed protein product [Cyprideis torosa]|uniref:Uncharacterized protein n=1 Tax=Cyprideis torosa TaxID=163714 RepID=A0A7R8WBJ6_9CRUS|nr:unnamed protein product [Cyprideis torosa]CAG0887006.1 unnamed protein product [Cyprideis torosa]
MSERSVPRGEILENGIGSDDDDWPTARGGGASAAAGGSGRRRPSDHQRHRDEVSRLLGDLLLKGYIMLAESCADCGTVLMKGKEHGDQPFCVSCEPVQPWANDQQQLVQSRLTRANQREAPPRPTNQTQETAGVSTNQRTPPVQTPPTAAAAGCYGNALNSVEGAMEYYASCLRKLVSGAPNGTDSFSPVHHPLILECLQGLKSCTETAAALRSIGQQAPSNDELYSLILSWSENQRVPPQDLWRALDFLSKNGLLVDQILAHFTPAVHDIVCKYVQDGPTVPNHRGGGGGRCGMDQKPPVLSSDQCNLSSQSAPSNDELYSLILSWSENQRVPPQDLWRALDFLSKNGLLVDQILSHFTPAVHDIVCKYVQDGPTVPNHRGGAPAPSSSSQTSSLKIPSETELVGRLIDVLSGHLRHSWESKTRGG